MTVAELIEKLKEQDPQAQVCRPGPNGLGMIHLSHMHPRAVEDTEFVVLR